MQRDTRPASSPSLYRCDKHNSRHWLLSWANKIQALFLSQAVSVTPGARDDLQVHVSLRSRTAEPSYLVVELDSQCPSMQSRNFKHLVRNPMERFQRHR